MSSDQQAPALPTSITAGHQGAVGTDLRHHDDHIFDDTPASALPVDEPRTPGWIPAVGLALFLAALVLVLATGDDAPRSGAAAPEPAEAAAQAPAERPTNAPMVVRGPTAPASAGAQPRPQRTPEQMKEIQRRMEEARGKQPAPPPANLPAAPH